ncbi:MAG: dephospho-CoA kinase [Campylobacterota bacterium]|nr:dephospho-CoA kinase [Campylobacterota bacterium]
MAFQYAIALTGGIATGKSTVASLLALNGLRVIDADAIAHKLLDENSAWVADAFGSEYLNRGKVDRSALGKLVFADSDAKAKLEGFLHPKIREAIETASEKQDSFKFPYLIDIPLFFETGAYDIEDSVVIYTPKATQLERFMKRNGFSEEESLRRIESQMDIDEKKKRATWVIDNSANLKHLQQECENFVDMIKKKFDYKH